MAYRLGTFLPGRGYVIGYAGPINGPKREVCRPTPPAVCELCGHLMPHGEEMFKYHGYSGPCPAPRDEE